MKTIIAITLLLSGAVQSTADEHWQLESSLRERFLESAFPMTKDAFGGVRETRTYPMAPGAELRVRVPSMRPKPIQLDFEWREANETEKAPIYYDAPPTQDCVVYLR